MFFKMIIIAFSFLFLAQCTNRDDEIKDPYFQYLSATTCIEDYQTINDLNISTVKIYSDSTNQRLLDIPAMWYCSLSPNVVYTELSNDTLYVELDRTNTSAWPGCNCPILVSAIVLDTIGYNYIHVNASTFKFER